MSLSPEFEFQPYPKIARLNREIIITEKIDGTNAAIIVRQWIEGEPPGFRITADGLAVAAQSRSRILKPAKGDDNFGFARWVHDHFETLAGLLGPGLHFGEWWGAGVQRTYGLKTKAFSLFNASRWAEINAEVGGVPVRPVPVLYTGPWNRATASGEEFAPDWALEGLRFYGSAAAPGFMKPEGIVVFHKASGSLFKATVEKDEQPKGVNP